MMSMNLDWKRDNYGSYIAQLPHVPGYQDTFSVQVYHFMGISASGDWHLTINNRPNPTIFLYKDIPGIVFHAKTPEELMNNVEERLTPEMIADALAAKGYEPFDNTTASRKADKRIAHFDLNWEENNYARVPYYYADFPSIPGYTAPGYMTEAIVGTPTVDLNDVYSFTLMLGGINEGGVTPLNTVQLHSDDFGIPYRDTPEEAMQDLENLSMDDIIFVLQQEGCQPYEED